ncbi:hypothetical protein HPB50_014883 [Hyalomma asiaticum]|uniref:Uncharacterized protein n=1 Tax=Hyalomma asiaticum TaxID=266040 RepID=A0ACB7T2P0_HYAAI|nr:hypothetical protein HPB50_014883 [Hyalomma asiaticum]
MFDTVDSSKERRGKIPAEPCQSHKSGQIGNFREEGVRCRWDGISATLDRHAGPFHTSISCAVRSSFGDCDQMQTSPVALGLPAKQPSSAECATPSGSAALPKVPKVGASPPLAGGSANQRSSSPKGQLASCTVPVCKFARGSEAPDAVLCGSDRSLASNNAPAPCAQKLPNHGRMYFAGALCRKVEEHGKQLTAAPHCLSSWINSSHRDTFQNDVLHWTKDPSKIESC